MSFELVAAAAFAVAAVVVYAVWRRARRVNGGGAVDERVTNGVEAALPKPPPGVQERRSDQRLLQEMIEDLAQMRADYVRFASRMLMAVSVVAVATCAALVVGGFGLRDARDASDDAQQAADEVRVLAAQNSQLLVRLDDVADEAKRQADRLTAALCAVRANLQAEVSTSEEFLRENPAGIPGVPVETIEFGMQQTRATVKALAPLRCRTVRG